MDGAGILLNLLGGVALLLWATRMVRTGVVRAYGAGLRRAIGRSTRHRLTAFGLGIGAAALLQSATATAMLLSQFSARGLIADGAGLAVMLGADVGSTLVVQLLSFGIAWLSPALLLVGVIAFLAGSTARWRQLGRILIGLGLMLLSLTLIVAASAPMRDSPALVYMVTLLSGAPLIALLLAALVTWLAHSSVAIVLLVMSLATTGILPLELVFVLVLGANVGGAIVPLALSWLDSNRRARRIPAANLAVRGACALALLPLLGLLTPELTHIGADPARQVANFHTAFNLGLALLFLPLAGLLGGLAARLFPAVAEAGDRGAPRHLDPGAVERPTVALACATREILRMADIVEEMLRGVIEVFANNDEKLQAHLSALDDDVDRLHNAIKLYLTRVSRRALPEDESQRCVELIIFTTNLEHVGDIIDKNLLELAQKKIKRQLTFSEQGWAEITEMHAEVVRQMQLALTVFVSGEVPVARQLIMEKDHFRELERRGSEHHLERLRAGRIESIESSALHLDILRDLKRIASHLTSVAYPILDAEGELRHSRLRTPRDTGDTMKSGAAGS
jgi:phosphate:Na+ symporter